MLGIAGLLFFLAKCHSQTSKTPVVSLLDQKQACAATINRANKGLVRLFSFSALSCCIAEMQLGWLSFCMCLLAFFSALPCCIAEKQLGWLSFCLSFWSSCCLLRRMMRAHGCTQAGMQETHNAGLPCVHALHALCLPA